MTTKPGVDARGGRRPDVVQPSFSGLTDEVRTYSEALAPAQVAALAVAPSIAGPTLVVAQNGDLLDFSWNSLDGMQYDLVSNTDLRGRLKKVK